MIPVVLVLRLRCHCYIRQAARVSVYSFRTEKMSMVVTSDFRFDDCDIVSDPFVSRHKKAAFVVVDDKSSS